MNPYVVAVCDFALPGAKTQCVLAKPVAAVFAKVRRRRLLPCESASGRHIRIQLTS